MSLFDDVSKSFNDAVSTGAPAVIAGIDSYAAEQLSKQATENQKQAQAATADIMKNGKPATGIMKSIQDSFLGIGQNQIIHDYGIYILLGLVGIYIVAKKL